MHVYIQVEISYINNCIEDGEMVQFLKKVLLFSGHVAELCLS
jgi:hypothetical protein